MVPPVLVVLAVLVEVERLQILRANEMDEEVIKLLPRMAAVDELPLLVEVEVLVVLAQQSQGLETLLELHMVGDLLLLAVVKIVEEHLTVSVPADAVY